jgi:pimeloyl-ACP methyl ester carboxylesterase
MRGYFNRHLVAISESVCLSAAIILSGGLQSAVGQSFKNQYYPESYKATTGKISKTTVRDKSYKFDHADYSIFIPDSLTAIRGIFIHQHGCTMEGSGEATAYDVQYQAFAKKWHLAIIGPDIYPTAGAGCQEWINPEDGSGPALLTAINRFAKSTGHPELKKVPWLLWGHSGGGYWVLKMLTEYPDRILAAFCYSAAFNPDIVYPISAARIPVMLRHAGKTDLTGCWQTASQAFLKLRKIGGYASLAYTAGQTHNFSYVRYMAIPFFEAALRQRLPDPGSEWLKDMVPAKAWLGDTLTHKIYKRSAYKGNRKSLRGMSLLPDSVSAAKWKEYVSTGTVADHTPPPAPYDLQIKRDSDTTVYLTWKVRGDIESPISFFHIYKNGRSVGRYPASGAYQTFDTNGDNAIPVMPAKIKFTLPIGLEKSDTLAVSEVNQFNLESSKTKPITGAGL